MTDRSRCRSAELASLLAADRCAAPYPGGYVVCTRALALVEALTGLGVRHSWELLLDLARNWVIAVPLIDTQGNIGSHTWPAEADRPWHVECRLSRAGQAVLDAEAHRIAPVPAGLINGSMWRGGLQPPLAPFRVIAVLRHLLDHPDAPDEDVLALAGPPLSLTGCEVSGDLDALAAGKQITLRQTGRIRLTGNPIPEPPPARDPAPRPGRVTVFGYAGLPPHWAEHGEARAQLIIESLPPGTADDKVAQDLAMRVLPQDRPLPDGAEDELPLAAITDLGNSRNPIRIAITLAPGADPVAVRGELSALDGITTETAAAYPAPLATLLRTWTRQHSTEDIADSLTRFEDAIRQDRADKNSADP